MLLDAVWLGLVSRSLGTVSWGEIEFLRPYGFGG